MVQTIAQLPQLRSIFREAALLRRRAFQLVVVYRRSDSRGPAQFARALRLVERSDQVILRLLRRLA